MKARYYIAPIGLIGLTLFITNMGCSSGPSSSSSTPTLKLFLNVSVDSFFSNLPVVSYAIFPVAILDPVCDPFTVPNSLTKLKLFDEFGKAYAMNEHGSGSGRCVPVITTPPASKCFYSISGGSIAAPLDDTNYTIYGIDVDPFYDYANNILTSSFPSTNDYLLYDGKGTTGDTGFNSTYFHCNSGDVVTVSVSCYTPFSPFISTASETYSCA